MGARRPPTAGRAELTGRRPLEVSMSIPCRKPILCLAVVLAGPAVSIFGQATVQVTQGNLDSFQPAFAANGRYVAFASNASNLLPPGVDTNGVQDVFVYDRQTGAITRESVGP